jgi:WD40 repeat protein
VNDLAPKEKCPECGLEIPPGQGCLGCSLRLALSPEAITPTEARRPVPPGLKSRFFADYEIIEEIARGGMGVVYRARQLGINRQVALKMVQSAHLLSDEARLRFRMEIEAVAQLHHPHIVSLYESGEHEGAHFFTMRLVEGGDLASHLNLQRPVRERVQQLITICRAVHYAHQRGILHRDLKPSNILLDERGEPHVADFGLAKSLDQDTGFTFTSSVLGSPNYMAPEQAAGKTRQLTTAVDVYGLGAILYHLVAGRPPFQAKTPIETLRQVVDQDPLPPRQANPQVDRDLETITLKCLRKEPSARYGTAEELAEDLERWLGGLPILARPLGPISSAWRWSRRRPALAGLCLVSLIAAITLTIGSNLAARRLKTANDRSVQLVKQLQREKVESLLDGGESSKALALLAHLLEREPQEIALGARLMSVLAQRSFAMPTARPWSSGSEIVAVGFSRDGNNSLALARNGRYRYLDLRTQQSTDGSLESASPPIVSARTHPVSDLLTTVHSDGVRIWRIAPRLLVSATLPHDATIRSLTLDPRSPKLATVDDRSRVRLWQPSRSQEDLSQWSSEILVHSERDAIQTCVFNAQGTHLALGYESGLVQIWSSQTRSLEKQRVMKGTVLVQEFDASGRWLATATDLGQVSVWDLEQPETNLDYYPFDAGATDVEFSPDGRFLALAGWSHRGEAYVWDLRLGRRVTDALVHRSHVTSVRFSPDGTQLVTLGDDATARCWDTSTWRSAREPLIHSSGVLQVAFSQDSRRLVTGSYSGALWWDMAPPLGQPRMIPHDARVTRGAFSPNGALTATATLAGKVHLWNTSDLRLVQSYQPHHGYVHFLEFSPSGRFLATGDAEGTVHLQNATEGLSLGTLPHPAPILSMRFSSDSGLIATAGRDGFARLWHIPSGEPACPPLNHGAPLLGAEFSPDGRWIATHGGNHLVRLWDTRSGRAHLAPLAHDALVEQVEFSPDSRFLVTGGRDAQPVRWELATGKQTNLRSISARGVSALAFSPDGRLLACASHDGTLEILDTTDRQLPSRLIAPTAAATHLQFTPDGRWVCSVTLRGEAQLWDPLSGLPITDPLRTHPSCSAACLSPDGASLLSFGDTEAAGLWPLPRFETSKTPSLIRLAQLIGRKQISASGQFAVTAFTPETPAAPREELKSLLFLPPSAIPFDPPR